MASERGLKLRLLCCVLALMALSLAAGQAYPSARLLSLCGLLGLPFILVLGHSLQALAPRRAAAVQEVPSALAPEQQARMQQMLELEMRLEHAPIALFSLDQQAQQLQPMNNNARRLLAPGRASDSAALCRTLAAQTPGQRSLIGFDTERGLERALLASSQITLQGQSQRLLALMPVESELEAEAMHAWQQLVHVLTHEIMNSLTPVASLSATAQDLLAEARPHLPPALGADLDTALDAISRRARSLAEFVASYRSLTRQAQPAPNATLLSALFARLSALVGPDWQARGGKAAFSVAPESLELMTDAGQLEQALLNLLSNAAEATAHLAAPQVGVSARLARGGRLRLEISDNGPGVPDELLAHIFTPFFTTKEKGSGIGLAMVRQLIHANGGTVRYAKAVQSGGRFVVTF
ncbi:MAG: sensor histidine kinase [Burkholderiales bacterium]|nr:sensor histidine kinase [Burkholderiales bacterium]